MPRVWSNQVAYRPQRLGYRSAQGRRDLTQLSRRMLAGKRSSGDQILAFCQIPDEYRLEADFPDQAAGKVNRIWIVTGDGNSNQIARPMRDLVQ